MRKKISFTVNSTTCVNTYTKEAQIQFSKLNEVLTCPWAFQQGSHITDEFCNKKT